MAETFWQPGSCSHRSGFPSTTRYKDRPALELLSPRRRKRGWQVGEVGAVTFPLVNTCQNWGVISGPRSHSLALPKRHKLLASFGRMFLLSVSRPPPHPIPHWTQLIDFPGAGDSSAPLSLLCSPCTYSIDSLLWDVYVGSNF